MMFEIGLIADIQYGDIPDENNIKFFRAGLEQAGRAVDTFNSVRPEFVVNLGDIIEGGCAVEQAKLDLAKTLSVLGELDRSMRWYHVIGNHCLKSLDRAYLHAQLGLPPAIAYYSFCDRSNAYRFVVLDALDVSLRGTQPDTPERELATKLLSTLQGPNILDWNGAISERQLTWFDNELREATAASQRVIVFCHIPFAPEATSQRHLLWNWQQVLDVLDKHSHVVACIYGHYHKGSYALRNNVHHITLNGVLEAPITEHCYATLQVFPERLELKAHGFQSRTFKI